MIIFRQLCAALALLLVTPASPAQGSEPLSLAMRETIAPQFAGSRGGVVYVLSETVEPAGAQRP